MPSRRDLTLNGYSSNEIRNLKLRCPKFWKWVDWVMSEQCDKQSLKKDVVLTLLPKMIPTKIEQDITFGHKAYARNVFDRLGIPYVEEMSIENEFGTSAQSDIG